MEVSSEQQSGWTSATDNDHGADWQPAAELAPVGGSPWADAMQLPSEVRVSGPAVTASAPPKPYVDPSGRRIGLVPFVVPAKDLIDRSGKWQRTADGLESAANTWDVLVLPHEPPDECDFVIEFTRRVGNDSVTQLLAKPRSAGRPLEDRGFECTMGGWGNTVCGFGLIDGRAPNGNRSRRVLNAVLVNDRRRTSVVEVRKDGVRAFLDGVRVAEWRGGYAAIANSFAEMRTAYGGLYTNDGRTAATSSSRAVAGGTRRRRRHRTNASLPLSPASPRPPPLGRQLPDEQWRLPPRATTAERDSPPRLV